MSIEAAIRPLTRGDRDRLLRWRNLPEVARWMYTDHRISEEEHARWFEAALDGPDRRYWIVECDGRPVGLTNLTRISREEGRAELGYYLAEPEARGRGLGVFAQYAAIEAAFGALGLQEVRSEALIDNTPSIRLLERLGFEQEAVLKDRAVKAGKPVDVLRFRLRAADWRRLREPTREMLTARGYRV